MTPCSELCPFVGCDTCPYAGWTCQACGQLAPPNDPVCEQCGRNP